MFVGEELRRHSRHTGILVLLVYCNHDSFAWNIQFLAIANALGNIPLLLGDYGCKKTWVEY